MCDSSCLIALGSDTIHFAWWKSAFVMAVLVLQKMMQTEMQILICVLVSWTLEKPDFSQGMRVWIKKGDNCYFFSVSQVNLMHSVDVNEKPIIYINGTPSLWSRNRIRRKILFLKFLHVKGGYYELKILVYWLHGCQAFFLVGSYFLIQK